MSALAAVAAGCNQLPIDPTGIGGGVGSGGGAGPGGGTGIPAPAPLPTVTGTPVPAPEPSPTSTVTPAPAPSGTASTCVSSDPERICLGLHLVAYTDPSGVPTINRADADVLVGQMNAIWSKCNIGFQMEHYEAADPTVVGLSFGNESQYELNSIRNEFAESATMLVTVTGPWTGKTIAWTSMPGGGPYGTIVEQDYGHNPMTVGHELGHYQGLYHISDYTNLMNPYIGSDTSALNTSQCATARATDQKYWANMMRR